MSGFCRPSAFGGRGGPGEPGEAKTIAYLAKSFAEAGFAPGGEHGGWTQDVPLVRLDRLPGATMMLNFGGAGHPLTLGRDATLALRLEGRTVLTDAPLVFAGFGVVDPKRGWDAYAGIDMTGKVAVVLANDPDFEAGRDLGFEGRRMTLAGRFIEGRGRRPRRRGGDPCHSRGGGGKLPVQPGRQRRRATANGPRAHPSATIKASGWLARGTALELLRVAGLDLEELKARARSSGFRAFALPATLSFDGSLQATPITSHNVIGRLAGVSARERPCSTAHTGTPTARTVPTRAAMRSATARSTTRRVPPSCSRLRVASRAAPARPGSIVVAAWTAEEKGLLGSDHYAKHPLWPLERRRL